MKTRFFVKKLDKDKELAIWYYGRGIIAEIEHLNRKILIKTTDSIYIIDETGKRLRKLNAYKTLEKLGLLNDSDLYKHNNKVFYDFFGEFDFVYINMQNGAEEELGNDEMFSYTKAVKYAQSTIKRDKFWIDTEKPVKRVTTIGVNEKWLKYVNGEPFVPPRRKRV